MLRFLRKSYGNAVTIRKFCTKQQTAGIVFANSYSAEENSRILESINGLNVAELSKFMSKPRAQRIKRYQERNGKVSSLDQILELDGFGVKVLEKLCNNIVTGQEKPEAARRISSFCTPSVEPKTRVKLKSCLGVHVSINSISWAKLSFEQPMNLTACGDSALPEKLHLPELVTVTKEICTSLPEADAYIIETPPVTQPSIPGKNVTQANVSVARSQVIAMTSLGLMYKQQETMDNEEQKIFFLKTFLPARLFRTLVGTERVSVYSTVEQLLNYRHESNSSDPTLAEQVNVSQEIRQVFAQYEGHTKDHLGQAFLTALAFARVCVQNNEKSLNILAHRGP